MRTDLFDFELPPDRIALRPVTPRDAARLLVVHPGRQPQFEDRAVQNLPDLLRPGDALVVNDTKVFPARLRGRRLGRGAEPVIKVTLHVGAGTFLPVKADDTAAHRMHAERGSVSTETADALNATRRAGGRIVAVGSTSLRLIESASDADGALHAFDGETALFITP